MIVVAAKANVLVSFIMMYPLFICAVPYLLVSSSVSSRFSYFSALPKVALMTTQPAQASLPGNLNREPASAIGFLPQLF